MSSSTLSLSHNNSIIGLLFTTVITTGIIVVAVAITTTTPGTGSCWTNNNPTKKQQQQQQQQPKNNDDDNEQQPNGRSSSSTSTNKMDNKETLKELTILKQDIISSEYNDSSNINHNEQQQQQQQSLLLLEQQRIEERTGRIRAEVKLRQVTKELQQMKNSLLVLQQQQQQQHPPSNDTTTTTTTNVDDDYENDNIVTSETTIHTMLKPTITTTTMLIESIGIVSSPFTKRMGTPRQPQLVPASYGYIQFHATCPSASFDGIKEYSHLWIIFEFHANTDTTATNKKCKIRPPRAPYKVGQLATRSPHRPNPIGLSLVRFVRWDPSLRRLYLSGIDLVNGTPVYDIKPCVPWDIPGYYDSTTKESYSSFQQIIQSILKVPTWVIQDDELQNVIFTEAADKQLYDAVITNQLLVPHYAATDDGYRTAQQAIQQILAQDPRSSHKGLKHNARGTKIKQQDDSSTQQQQVLPPPSAYNIIFGQIQVSFIVTADTGVIVTDIQPVTFQQDNYVDGIPLILATADNNKDTKHC